MMRYLIYAVVIVLVVLAIAFMFIDLRGLYHCSVCGKTYWGKKESIKDKPACDECHEKWYVENCEKKELGPVIKSSIELEPENSDMKIDLTVGKVTYEPIPILGLETPGPVEPIIVFDKNQKALFVIKENGDFILRGKKITNDKEVAERIMGSYLGKHSK